MKTISKRFYFLVGAALLAACVLRAEDRDTPIVPGLQPDGLILLHNQWSIDPAGRQVELGDFPVNMAVSPDSRYAVVLHAGYGQHELRVVDLKAARCVQTVPVAETFFGIAFSRDGRKLICSGGGDGVIHEYSFHDGRLSYRGDVRLVPKSDKGVLAGVALRNDGRDAIAGFLFSDRLARVDLSSGHARWTRILDKTADDATATATVGADSVSPNDVKDPHQLVRNADPLSLIWDQKRGRVYMSLWGESSVRVLDANTGRDVALWKAGLHPNQLLLSKDGRRLYVSNGGGNTVTVIDTRDGHALETLVSSFSADDRPGSTPDSLALSPDGKFLYVANAYNDDVAVFDVTRAGESRPLGFIPTGWFPTAVRVTPDGRHLLVLSARGLRPKPNNEGQSPKKFKYIASLYRGALGIVDLPRDRDDFEKTLAKWTETVRRCRPKPVPEAIDPRNPVPERIGGKSPIKYVIYVIKENRTYDQVFGDIAEGNGDPALCLFPEKVTPNLHALVRQFVLLDNFYANAEVSASGHEWSMGAYASEFVEKLWPINYGHWKGSKVPYPAEGNFAAAIPALGYLWDRAAAAGVSYRSYGEFTVGGIPRAAPQVSNLSELKGGDHLDPNYRGWDLDYPDRERVKEFISELHRFEKVGGMPRLQVMRLPEDHTYGGRAGKPTPSAMVGDNDRAVGELVEAVSHSKFWPETAIFIVEDDAQSGPDHVDAHRTEALVISPYTKRHAVDSTPYTTCSMLRTMELILGLQPMSQFDALAQPMRASFQDQPELKPFTALPEQIDLHAKNPAHTKVAAISASFNFSKEDMINDQIFNRVIWAAVRGWTHPMPAPVHAAFVRTLPKGDDND